MDVLIKSANQMEISCSPLVFRNPKRRRSSRQHTKYLGVRRRPWGRYAAEILNPYTKERHWLGTFDTAEEAAFAYDLSSISFSGVDNARTNFCYPNLFPSRSLLPPPPPPTPEFEECDDHLCLEDDILSWNKNEVDDESLVIASILKSFCTESSNFSFNL